MSNDNVNAESAMERAFNAINGNVHGLAAAYARDDIYEGGCAVRYYLAPLHFEGLARKHIERVAHFEAKIEEAKMLLIALDIDYVTTGGFISKPPSDAESDDAIYLKNDGHFTVFVNDTVCSYDALTDVAYVGDVRYAASDGGTDPVLIRFATGVLALLGHETGYVLAKMKEAIEDRYAV